MRHILLKYCYFTFLFHQKYFCQAYIAPLLSFVFNIIGIFKNSLIFSEKIKPFEFKSNFLSSCIRKNRFKGIVWVAFHGVSKALFSIILRFWYYPYLSKNFEIVSEKMKILDFWSNFHRFHIRYNSYLKFLFRQLFVIIAGLTVGFSCVST